MIEKEENAESVSGRLLKMPYEKEKSCFRLNRRQLLVWFKQGCFIYSCNLLSFVHRWHLCPGSK